MYKTALYSNEVQTLQTTFAKILFVFIPWGSIAQKNTKMKFSFIFYLANNKPYNH